jgi:lipoate---protein ligase
VSDSLILLPYDLPDAGLLTAHSDGGHACVFIPEQVMVVIGKGSDPALELHAEAILDDRVPVLRRGTGGCAVVLSPNMLVVSFALYEAEQQKSSDYFRAFNGIIIRSFGTLGIADLSHAGISDIARHGRKIAGSALYRNRLMVFYHAVINLASGTNLMERYLKHPPRTPDYRENRPHEDFVTSLAAEGFVVEPESISEIIETEFRDYQSRAHTT